MSEREQQIAAIITEEVRQCRNCWAEGLEGIADAAARIAALPQPITTETVRRVRVATTAVLQNNQGFGGEMGAEQMQALDEAIAQSANVEVKYEG